MRGYDNWVTRGPNDEEPCDICNHIESDYVHNGKTCRHSCHKNAKINDRSVDRFSKDEAKEYYQRKKYFEKHPEEDIYNEFTKKACYGFHGKIGKKHTVAGFWQP